MTREHLNPANLPNWAGSFSQVVAVATASARLVFVSGQVAVDAENEVVGRGDLAAQAEWAFANLARALAAGGATPDDVVRLGIYVKDLRSDQTEVIRQAMRTVFTGDRLPTSTWLGVAALALDDLLIEVEATAVVG